MPPTNLAVYLSNRCNLDCRYCYVAVNIGEPRYLCLGQVKDALERFLEPPSAAERKVSFLGGEPLLRWGVLEESVRHVRARAPGLLIQVFTNGLELTPKRLDFLLGHGVEVTVSLDGRREANDANRRLHGRGGSSFDAVMERLAPLPKESLGVNLVFTTRTLDSLLSNIHFFQDQGFGRLSFTPDIYEAWPEPRILALRRTMEGFARYYSYLVNSGARPFAIANLYAILEKTRGAPGGFWWEDCHNLVLGGDGAFYSCDKSLGLPFERIQGERVGSTAAGVDWARREAFYREARELVAGAARDPHGFTSCPMAVYFLHRTLGGDAGAAVRNLEDVSNAYGGPLLELAARLWDVPSFREAHHIAPGTPAPAPAVLA